MSIDFKSIAATALSNGETLLLELFPAGVREGNEFCVGSIYGEAGTSLKCNLNSGVWRDFAGDEGGADLISLWAAVRCHDDMGEAARQLSERLSMPLDAKSAPRTTPAPRSNPDEWEAHPFAPEDTPPPTEKRIFSRSTQEWQPHTLTGVWRYTDSEGRLVGYTCRVDLPDG